MQITLFNRFEHVKFLTNPVKTYLVLPVLNIKQILRYGPIAINATVSSSVTSRIAPTTT